LSQSVTDISNNIDALLKKAYTIRVNNLKTSIELGEEALAISRKLNNKELIGRSLNELSLFYMIKGEYVLSTKMAEEAIKHFIELNDEKGIADAKYNLAGIYYKTDNFHLGLVFLIDSLTTYLKYNDYHNQARTYKSLGTVYEYFGDQKNAIKSYESSIKAARVVGDSALESNAYSPLSGIYLKHNKITKANDIIQKAITIKKQAGDTRGLAFALYGRAKIYSYTGEYQKAEQDFKDALKIHLDAGEKLGTAMAYRKMGELYIKIQEFKKAKTILKKALRISDDYNIAITRFKSNYLLYQIAKLEKNDSDALKYLEKYFKQKETVINAQTLQVIENYELITKMKELEKEAELQKERAEIIEKKNRAEHAFKIRQEFLSTMSHEIRTPLNAVITISSLLNDRSDTEDQQLLNSLRFAANNLLQIINDILDFTKLDSGKAKLEIRTCNFSMLLDNLKNIYDSLAKEKGLKLSLKFDPNLSQYYELDETKMSQILGNLISNAIKYTEQGKVNIEVDKIGGNNHFDQIIFKITDTGVGILQIHHDEIFDSFFQPESITTRKQGGSGLGLAIVKKLVELHGSKIHLKSTVGIGSTFYFELTVKKGTLPDKTSTKTLDKLKNKKVLLAEDNMINAMVATKLLANWGIITEHAKNGKEAVEKSRSQHFDFILMDLHMPEMNGFDATLQIRQKDNLNNKTPIFALTADITADQQEDYIAYFNGFLRKPIEIDQMYDVMIKS